MLIVLLSIKKKISPVLGLLQCLHTTMLAFPKTVHYSCLLVADASLHI